MLRLAAFRPSSEKVTKLQLHPTYPWLVSADLAGNVVVWDWQYRQVVYEVNALGVDERRLAGAQLQGESEPRISKLSQAIKDIKGGSVKHVKFYDDDVRYWQGWLARAAVSQSVTQDGTPPGGHQPTGPGPVAIRGRHFLVICCDSKAIFLDMVSMRAKDVPKLVFDNKAPLCVEFLPRSGLGDGPLAAFGGPDGVIRVLSMQNWLVVQRFSGAHKGPIACLKTFLAVSGETLLVSGGNDGLLTFWSVDNAREATPKLSVKGHDGGVVGIELIRVQGGPPQLVTIGADKTMAVWDTLLFKEMRRLKPISKMSCTSVATWSHPRAPNLNILTCAKDSHIWTVEHYGGVTRPLCDLTIMVPPAQLPTGKKLKTYCLAVHPLQPHLVAAGTNFGVFLCDFDAKAVPAIVALPTPVGSKEHRVVCNVERELRLLTFQLSSHINPTVINAGDTGARFRAEAPTEAPSLLVRQVRSRLGPVATDSAAILATSHSGKYVSVVWPELPKYEVYLVDGWVMVDNGIARHFAWDSCKDRYALLQTVSTPSVPPPGKHGSSRKAREAAAAHAAAIAASAAAAAAAAKVEVRILLDDGSSNLLMRSIEGRSEPVIGLHGGALLGVAYKFPRKSIPIASPSSVGTTEGAFVGEESPNSSTRVIGEAPANFQLYSWENFRPVSQMLPQPEWTAWDQTVEYCALAYHRYIVIASLRPQYRFLGTVAIGSATGGVWHRRQLFISTPTTIECVFVDAGVSALDLERKRKKEEQKAHARAGAQQGELALLTVEAPKVADSERVALRPPMLQVVRLAAFHTGPAAPPVLVLPKPSRLEQDGAGPLKELEERRVTEVAIGGGGVSMAVSRLPQEQKRPVGPLRVVGVRDGVLWLVDMFMTAHAIALSHPGIRCRCLAAYGDAVSAVKWASRLGREHHDDLAQFLVGMGYAAEALHLPGISKRLEFDLAIQSGDLKRALQALITLSNSKGFSQGVDLATDKTGILSVTTNEEVKAEAVFGVVKFAQEFLELIDAADATGQGVIAHQALTRLAAAGAVEGGLSSAELRALSFRLAAHGELTRLAVQANRMVSAGLGREAALAGAFLGDPNVLEKAWEDTGMFPEGTLHAQAHGRSSIKNLLQQWNKVLQKQYVKQSSKALPEIGATVDPVLAALEGGALAPQKDGVLQSLSQSRQPLIQILPPANVPTAPVLALPSSAKSAVLSGPMLGLPAPATVSPQTLADATQTTSGGPPSSGLKEPSGSSEAVPVSQTQEYVSGSKSDLRVLPVANGVASDAMAAQGAQDSSNATNLSQLAQAAKTSVGADAAQSVPSSETPSAGDLMQVTSTVSVATDSTGGVSFPPKMVSDLSNSAASATQPLGPSFQAFPAQPNPLGPSFQAALSQQSQSVGPGFQGYPSQPLGPGFHGFPQPLPTEPLTSHLQSFPPQLTQSFGPGFQAFFPQSTQSFGSGFQSFPPQSTQPLGPGSQAFSSQSPQYGTGFQAFPPSTQQAFGSGFQAFPPLSNQSVAPMLHAFPPHEQPGTPSFQAFSSANSSGPPFASPGQSGTPSFQAFPPKNPSGPPFPPPGQSTFQAVPPSYPTGSQQMRIIPPPTPAGRPRSFPPGGRTSPGGGSQPYPLPMSTSTSVGAGRQQFPFPMSTSTSVSGYPQRGTQSSSDLELVPVGGSTAPQQTSSDKQLVPISSPAEPENDRPFF